MSGIPKQRKLSLCPRGQLFHVHQLPHLYACRVYFLGQGKERRVEVLVYFEELAEVGFLVPFCVLVRIPSETQWLEVGLLTVAGVRVRFRFGVDAVEVEQFVVVAGIHDDPAVRTVPNH